MLYPSKRAVFLMGLGFPITLAVTIFAPGLWPIGAAWVALIIGLMAVDMIIVPSPAKLKLSHNIPARQFVGTTETITVEYQFKGKTEPVDAELKLSGSEELEFYPGTAHPFIYPDLLRTNIKITALRRGAALVTTLWLRYTGPMGLVWWSRRDKLDYKISVVPDTRLVKEKALEFFSRDAQHGEKKQSERGEGTEFDALREFTLGMDIRAIDWKHSARHRKILAKEFRSERNHNIVFAIDTGYLMSDPLAGMARLDWAINASLLVAYVSLKHGDRVGFFGFDAKPYLFAKPVAGTGAFGHIQHLTTELDYSTEETNFTLGLSTLSKSLRRRSLVIVYTEFVDTTNAELMLENISRLIKNHMVMFVTFQDKEIETLINTSPTTPKDVSRAVIAAQINKEREIVLAKLERMGVQIVRADIENMSVAVLNRFLKLKRKEMI